MSIKLPKFVNFVKTDEDWVVVAGLVMNEDTDEDMMGLAFYSIEGSFKGLEDANMATKVVLDGVWILFLLRLNNLILDVK